MIEAILQFVIACSSALTATFAAYIARKASEAHETIYQNEERSQINRKVLRREGIYQPPVPKGGRDE